MNFQMMEEIIHKARLQERITFNGAVLKIYQGLSTSLSTTPQHIKARCSLLNLLRVKNIQYQLKCFFCLLVATSGSTCKSQMTFITSECNKVCLWRSSQNSTPCSSSERTVLNLPCYSVHLLTLRSSAMSIGQVSLLHLKNVLIKSDTGFQGHLTATFFQREIIFHWSSAWLHM